MSRPKGSPKTVGSGRKKGTPNRRTIERRLLGEARADGKPLAKEVLEANMLRYVELANSCLPPASGRWAKEQEFHFYTQKASDNARMLAPYQSPTYRSITVEAPREPAVRGTPAIDALEAFVLALARARKVQPPEPKTIEPSADETPTLVAVR
ncbi:MAG TPA: hypothetical protein VKB56_08010 [Terriglobales bacterium]|nr:hypothetical protein [Terriglobales bacterium]